MLDAPFLMISATIVFDKIKQTIAISSALFTAKAVGCVVLGVRRFLMLSSDKISYIAKLRATRDAITDCQVFTSY